MMDKISASDHKVYMETARRRAQAHASGSDERRERAWAAARRAAAFIKERYPAARIRAFGSLLYPDSFGERSDIDLAVESIPWPGYLSVWGQVERSEPEFKIDLVDVGIVSEGLRAVIKDEGIEL